MEKDNCHIKLMLVSELTANLTEKCSDCLDILTSHTVPSMSNIEILMDIQLK